MPEDPPKASDETETAREDLILIVAGSTASLVTAAVIGSVVWYDLDKLFAMLSIGGILSAFGTVAYAVKARLW